MKAKQIIVALAMVFLVVMIGAAVVNKIYTVTQQPEQLAPEEDDGDVIQAPDFTVYDEAGQAVRLSDFEGRPVVLNFWASWCDPCKSEMPDFQSVWKQMGDEVAFVMVNATTGRESMDTATAFLEEAGLELPVYFDTQQEAVTAYNAYTLPMTFFVNAQGNLVTYAQGAIDAETLQRGIDMIRQAQ